MHAISRSALFCFVLGVVLVQSGIGKPGCQGVGCLKCPNITIPNNFTNETVLFQYLRGLYRGLWKFEGMPRLSPDAQDLVQILTEMVDSSYSDFINIASIQVLGVASYLLYVEDTDCRDFCAYAKVINASVEWYEEKNGNSSAAGLHSIGSEIPRNCHIVVAASLRASGCPPLEDLPPKNHEKCYKGGFVYKLSKHFKYFGRLLPCALRKSVFRLYNSKDYVDRALAILTVGSISSGITELLSSFSPLSNAELFQSLIQTNISVCCCESRKRRLLDSCDMIKYSVNSIVDTLIKDKYLYDECAAFTTNK